MYYTNPVGTLFSGVGLVFFLLTLAAAIVIHFLLARKAGQIAQEKGYNKRTWFHLCFWLGIIPFILLAAQPDLITRRKLDYMMHLMRSSQPPMLGAGQPGPRPGAPMPPPPAAPMAGDTPAQPAEAPRRRRSAAAEPAAEYAQSHVPVIQPEEQPAEAPAAPAGEILPEVTEEVIPEAEPAPVSNEAAAAEGPVPVGFDDPDPDDGVDFSPSSPIWNSGKAFEADGPEM